MATRNRYRGPRALLAALLALTMAVSGAPSALAEPEPQAQLELETEAETGAGAQSDAAESAGADGEPQEGLPSPVMQASQAIVRPGDDITFSVFVPLEDVQEPFQLKVTDELPGEASPLQVTVRDARNEDVTEEAGTAVVEGQVGVHVQPRVA